MIRRTRNLFVRVARSVQHPTRPVRGELLRHRDGHYSIRINLAFGTYHGVPKSFGRSVEKRAAGEGRCPMGNATLPPLPVTLNVGRDVWTVRALRGRLIVDGEPAAFLVSVPTKVITITDRSSNHAVGQAVCEAIDASTRPQLADPYGFAPHAEVLLDRNGRPRGYRCGYCGQRFESGADAGELRLHLHWKHAATPWGDEPIVDVTADGLPEYNRVDQWGRWACPDCDKTYTSGACFWKHVRRIHGIEPATGEPLTEKEVANAPR